MSSKFKDQVIKSTTDLNAHIDHETGEITEIKNNGTSRYSKVEKTGMVTVSTKDYVVVDSKIMDMLSEALTDSDLAKVLKMSLTTTTPFNVLTNSNNKFHNSSTLQQYLKMKSKSMFFKLIKRLVQEGVLYKFEGLIKGEVQKVYLMNPLLTRKRRVFDPKLKRIFTDFEKRLALVAPDSYFNNNTEKDIDSGIESGTIVLDHNKT